MKSKLIILSFAFFVILSIPNISCTNANAVKNSNQEIGNTNISEYGFVNVPSEKKRIADSVSTYYNIKTGLKYYTDDSISSFCKLNDLHISDAGNFKAEIPYKNKLEIISNYNKLKPFKHYYYDNFWEAYYQVGTYKYDDTKDPLNRKGIMVVAPPKLFNENAFIKKDPLVLVKVDGGWVELTRW